MRCQPDFLCSASDPVEPSRYVDEIPDFRVLQVSAMLAGLLETAPTPVVSRQQLVRRDQESWST